MKTLYLLRGVSGSGKTTFARELTYALDGVCHSADDFFYKEEGEFDFDPSLLNKAHSWCQGGCEDDMRSGLVDNIIIHNTSTSEKELKPYLDLATTYNYKVVSLIVENRHGNESVHDVPEKVLVRQERKLRNSIKLR